MNNCIITGGSGFIGSYLIQSLLERRLRIVRLGVVFGQWENGNYTHLYYALKKKRFAYIGRKTTIKGSNYVSNSRSIVIIR